VQHGMGFQKHLLGYIPLHRVLILGKNGTDMLKHLELYQKKVPRNIQLTEDLLVIFQKIPKLIFQLVLDFQKLLPIGFSFRFATKRK